MQQQTTSSSANGKAVSAPPAAAPATGGLTHEITHGPSFGMLRVDLKPGHTFVAEAGAMVAQKGDVSMEVKMNAGSGAGFMAKLKAFVIAIIRKVVGGETFFVNHFSVASGGSIWVSPTLPGHVTHRKLNGETLILSSGAYLAHEGNVEMKMKFGGIKGLLAKEGAFFIELSGTGDLWFNSYGGIETVKVDGGYVVDNGHLVGYEGGLTFDIGSAGGGLKGLLASGEGLVCKFNGTGNVYIQSRNLSATVDWINRLF